MIKQLHRTVLFSQWQQSIMDVIIPLSIWMSCIGLQWILWSTRVSCETFDTVCLVTVKHVFVDSLTFNLFGSYNIAIESISIWNERMMLVYSIACSRINVRTFSIDSFQSAFSRLRMSWMRIQSNRIETVICLRRQQDIIFDMFYLFNRCT
jgi:hypothetical protein